MSFPTSPSDGQLYTTALGTQYSYVAADTAWKITGGPGGGGTIKGSGTANVVAKWTDSSTIGDSIISANSAEVLIDATHMATGYGSNGRTDVAIRGCLTIDTSSELRAYGSSALYITTTGGVWGSIVESDYRGGNNPHEGGGLYISALGPHTSGECFAIKTTIPGTDPAYHGDTFIGGSLNAYTDVNVGMNEDISTNSMGILNVSGRGSIDFTNNDEVLPSSNSALFIKNTISGRSTDHANFGDFALYVEETQPMNDFVGDNYLGGPNFLGDTTIGTDMWGSYPKNLQVNGKICAGDPNRSTNGQLIINGGTQDDPTMGQCGIDATGMGGGRELVTLKSSGAGGSNATLYVANDTYDGDGDNYRGHGIYARTESPLSHGINNHPGDSGYAIYTDGDIGIRGVINTIEGKYYKDYLPITQTVMNIPTDQTGTAAQISEDNSIGGARLGFGIPRTVNSTFLVSAGDRIKLASSFPYSPLSAHYAIVGNGEIYVYDSEGAIVDYARFTVMPPNAGDPYTSTGTNFIDRINQGTYPWPPLTEDEYNKGYYPTKDSMILEVEGAGDSLEDPTMNLILECYSPNSINYVVGVSFKYFNIPIEIVGA